MKEQQLQQSDQLMVKVKIALNNKVVRDTIFRYVGVVNKTIHSSSRILARGRDMIEDAKRPDTKLMMIGQFAMPLDTFVRYYLPVAETVTQRVRCQAIEMYCAHRSAQLDTLLFLIAWANYPIRERNIVDYACSGGHVAIVQYLLKNNAMASKLALDNACSGGSLEIVQLLHTMNKGLSSGSPLNLAATKGHLEICKWLTINRKDGCTTSAMDNAASMGYLSVVEFLHTHRKEGCTTLAMTEAASNGHYQVVKFLHTHRSEGCSSHAMDGAAKNGHLKIVKFLHKHRREGCSSNAIQYAASRSDIDMVIFLKHNRTEGYYSNAIMDACKFGSLDIVQLLYPKFESNVLVREMAITTCIEYDRFNIFKWLYATSSIDMSLKFTQDSLEKGAKMGRLDIIQWYNDNTQGLEGSLDWKNMIKLSAENGRCDIIEWLHKNKKELVWTTYAMDKAAAIGSIETVVFLHNNRSEGCTTNAMDLAAKNQKLEMCIWLRENRSEGCTVEAIRTAFCYNRKPFMDFFKKYYSDTHSSYFDPSFIKK
ncbi:hypothetical protein DFA_06327 [Cavenderia fasciculata]|uniref:Ankyrin repeat-containing protein n=1 Tax=Cavenderia fasciculata TaxID=261658 RepID=F4PKQ6_CACFS|nr:uncharacterized protein DFA_06327 [Cavenderia fasciculata]EGG24180.1 hypothetical protein DFA_06327 [Cavenderia fasciculata]|eukprot:XP_004362031.1 hypothetical protein DFA_06327 [Cavenderia fasciculata]